MYLLFRYHHITPRQYYDMEYGEQTITKAFIHYQIEKLNEEIKRLNDN